MKVTGKDFLGVFLLAWAAGLTVGFIWLKLAWTTPVVLLVAGLATLGAFLLDPADVVAFFKSLPARFTSNA